MRDKILNLLLSAVVSATVTFATIRIMDRSEPGETSSVLKAKTLEVSDSILIRSPDKGDEAIILRNDGLVFAKGKVITEHFLGKQFSGNLLVGNRVLVSPNDLANDSPDEFEFMGEFGINQLTGSGELLVRSPQGGNHVGTGVDGGQFAQITFDQNDLLRFFVYDNHSKGIQLFADQKDRPTETESPLERSPVAPPIAGQPIVLTDEGGE